jgi:DNA polymerase-1
MLLSWLVNPNLSASLDNMAKRYFSHEMVKFKDVVKKGENFSSVTIEEASKYASEDAWMTLKLYNYLLPKLNPKLVDEAREVEYPFVNTLLKMEAIGIELDTEFFKTLLQDANKTITELTKEIYTLSGSEFNINSTKQLGVILFENLGLKTGKKTKTGYSTDEKVLNSLINEHKIIKKLLEYREIYKLRSTYIEPLLKLALKDEKRRIYTSFLQTGTSTGRLSSKNPNLQNIPVRTKLGRQIRKGFVAKSGYVLVGIDYSQIELRLLAHFSKDRALMDAFIEGKDIHLETAKKIFGEESAKEKRNIAKSINFGLLYGMGARKLAETIDVSQKEAKEYIENYFASFPTVRNYLIEIQDGAKKDGFIETLLARRRYFDYEGANAFLKASFERESVNALFQGSASDLMKLSMNKISNELENEDARMLLQIHDELIFEVKEQKAQEFAKSAKKVMQEIYKLLIPLECSVSIAPNWGGLK